VILEPPPAHDGVLHLIADDTRQRELMSAAAHAPSWNLTGRQLCDLELILNGGFSPLTGFMSRADYDSVCHRMRLRSGAVWPIPVVLDVTEDAARNLRPGSLLALRNLEGVVLAVLHVEDVYRPQREAEAQLVYGTVDREHPGVDHLLGRTNPVYVGGTVEGLQLPTHTDFSDFRMSPVKVR